MAEQPSQGSPTPIEKDPKAEEDQGEEDPATSEKLQAFLTAKRIPFDVTMHKACRTSQESAAVRGVSLDAGAKAILLKDVKLGYALAIMSASYRFHSKQFKKTSRSSKKISFATPEEVWQVTGCLPGAVPPFGSIFDIPIWVDRSLSRQSIIHFNCGLRTASISMTYDNYILAEQPHCGVFTEEEMVLGEN